MKKIVAIALLAAATTGAFAQGQITMGNTSTTLVKVQPFGTTTPVNAPVSGSTIRVGLLWADPAAPTVWKWIGVAGEVTTSTPVAAADYSTIGPVDGRIRNLTATTPSPYNADALFKYVGWDGAFGATPALFLANPLSFSNNALFGQSDTMAMKVQATSTALVPALADLFTTMTLTPVPEPSTIALGVLGALVLLFRRRK